MPDIDTFCTIVIGGSGCEGIRGEVVFEQAMLETGWLQFGGDASAVQFNFFRGWELPVVVLPVILS